MESSLFEPFATFVTESVRLLGWPRLLLSIAALCVVGSLAVWGVACVLCRGQRNIGAALSSPLMVLMICALAGSVLLITWLRQLLESAAPAIGVLGYVCLGICVLLLYVGVQGGFSATWWKAIILTVVLLSVMGGTGAAVAALGYAGQPAQFDLLAKQIAGHATTEPLLVTSPEAKKRIESRRAKVERATLQEYLNSLMGTYTELQTARATLNVNDHAAVLAFNDRAAAYSADTKKTKDRLAELETLLGK